MLARSSESFWLLQLVEGLACVVIMLAPTMLMGAAFPLMVRLLAVAPERTAAGVGTASAAGTAGCVVGVLGGGLVLLPLLGLQDTLFVAVGSTCALRRRSSP